jgi:hypothetical protein
VPPCTSPYRSRSINPVTGTNWQGTGVVPDTAVPEAEAYDVADGEALRHVLPVVTGTSRLRVNGTSDRPNRPAESLSCERSPRRECVGSGPEHANSCMNESRSCKDLPDSIHAWTLLFSSWI